MLDTDDETGPGQGPKDSDPVIPLITGAARLVTTESDRDKFDTITGPPYEEEDPTWRLYHHVVGPPPTRDLMYLTEYSFRGRVHVGALRSSNHLAPTSLWKHVHAEVDTAIAFEYGTDDSIPRVGSPRHQHFADLAVRVKAWLGPDMWAACLAAQRAANGSDAFERFIEALCAPTWNAMVGGLDRFEAELRDRGYPVPGQVWKCKKTGISRKVEQLGAVTVWLRSQSGLCETYSAREIRENWTRLDTVDTPF